MDKAVESKKEVSEKIKKSLNYSIKDAASASVMDGITANYTTPYAIAMNASNSQIAALTSIPNLLLIASQLISTKLMQKFPRKKIISSSILMQAIMLIPISILYLLYSRNMVSFAVTLLLLFFSLYSFFGTVHAPIWNSLIGDLVKRAEKKHLGKYFGIRNKFASLAALLATIAAGFILDLSKKANFLFAGFMAIYLIAFTARLISKKYIDMHYEPIFKEKKGYYFSFVQFVKKAPSNNFGRFVIYVSFMILAANIAGPFFSVYMLRDLGFSYLQYMILISTVTLSTVVWMPIWGRFSDNYGNIKAVKFCSFIVAALPILWLFSRNFWWVFIIQILSGFSWAGFNLGISNFVYDTVSRQRRGLCFAYFNILLGLGVFLGAFVGGGIAKLSINFLGYGIIPSIFLISGILRYAVITFFMYRFKEVRKVEDIDTIRIINFTMPLHAINPHHAIWLMPFKNHFVKMKKAVLRT